MAITPSLGKITWWHWSRLFYKVFTDAKFLELGHPCTRKPFNTFNVDLREEEEVHLLEVDPLNAKMLAWEIVNLQTFTVPLLHF